MEHVIEVLTEVRRELAGVCMALLHPAGREQAIGAARILDRCAEEVAEAAAELRQP